MVPKFYDDASEAVKDVTVHIQRKQLTLVFSSLLSFSWRDLNTTDYSGVQIVITTLCATKEKAEKGETLNGFTFVNQLLMESNRRQSNKPNLAYLGWSQIQKPSLLV